MGIEKDIKAKQGRASHGDRRREANEETAAREFADDVLRILRDAYDGPISGAASTEAERLAAALLFLRSQTIEYVRQVINHPQIYAVNHERMRIAMEAMQMLRDIGEGQRHPIHKFFRGANGTMHSRQTPTREFYKRAILVACIKALMRANSLQDWDRARAIRAMMKNPSIAQHIQSEAWMQTTFNRCDTAKYRGQVEHCLKVMDFQQARTTETILVWTAMAVNVREAPLDFATATMIQDRGVYVWRDGVGSGILPATPIHSELIDAAVQKALPTPSPK